jgi:Gene product 88
MKLLSTNAKLSKSVKGFLVMGLQLAPHNLAGGRTVCPNASAGCKAACLYTAGQGVYNRVKTARINRTRLFLDDKPTFMANLFADIEYYSRRAARKGLKLAVRLNTISDIPWEREKYKGKNMMEHFPLVTFYDYTKSFSRAAQAVSDEFPANYSLTFSRSETNELKARAILTSGGNVAVVFKGKGGKVTRGGHNKTAKLPLTYYGFPVINGDKNDARFNDPKGVVVGLLAKGKARYDKSGFVVLN